MKTRNLRGLLRMAAFFALLLVLIRFANTFLVQTDASSFMTLHEMKTAESIELALVGSSVVRNQFNPALISEQTGLDTFCAAIPCLAMPGSLALTSMLYDDHSPEWTVLFVEHDTFFTELTEAEDRLMPQLTNPLRRAAYLTDLCMEDGRWIDRFFLFKNLHVTSAAQLRKTVSLRLDPKAYLREHPGLVSGNDRYAGRGFVQMCLEEDIDGWLREENLGPTSCASPTEPSEADKRRLLQYRDMCARKGSRLLVVCTPNLTARTLAEPSYTQLRENLARFMEENGIAFVDFSLAKPELLPDLTDYYLDYFHVNAEGADILSASFARFFNLYAAGEDVSALFYGSYEEYLNTINYITNVYTETREDGEEEVVRAGSNRGPRVEAEYRFALVNEDGTETVVQDYSENREYRTRRSHHRGKKLRVYARAKGCRQDDHVYSEVELK